MHMADALISPQVGAVMWTATLAVGAYSVKKAREKEEQDHIALAGILGAFVFAAQMINFSIPGTGSSGHIGGGLLLSILLGPHLAFLTMAAILFIQALFFADGGLLSYGCNVFNLAFCTCFVAYPLFCQLSKKVDKRYIFSKGSIVLASVIGLQLGAFSVVLETLFSNKTELPFFTFVMLMQPIHLAIGLVEGFITAAIISSVEKTAPQILSHSRTQSRTAPAIEKLGAVFIVAALFTGGILSWFASTQPDGLEWSIEKVSGSVDIESASNVHGLFSDLQKKTAILPDYSFGTAGEAPETWPKADAGTSVSGIAGAFFTFLLVFIIGFALKPKNKPEPVQKAKW
ncbi:energy-coupling factor ABC transporter permease [Gracilinema caldarium]|uniref:energy-coupling factor ABC transporter permease n=1 Tax=Gracilinema caldarium TaxID=215591 RepID=UPI0026EAD667|nr:energy-coupling factor ABC transporter permease [Gracilinema caldarium]